MSCLGIIIPKLLQLESGVLKILWPVSPTVIAPYWEVLEILFALLWLEQALATHCMVRATPCMVIAGT